MMIEQCGKTTITTEINVPQPITQSKRGSLIETVLNTLIGFVVTLVFSPLIYSLAGVEMSASKMGISTLLFTILSVARGYVIRRFFNSRKI